jgi:hypothetical protein
MMIRTELFADTFRFGVGLTIIVFSGFVTILFNNYFKIKYKRDMNILEGFGAFSLIFDVIIALYFLWIS